MEKFSKFKPTRTKDGEKKLHSLLTTIVFFSAFYFSGLTVAGSLHMKLAQKPGEEAVYKFKVEDLRQLAKTAHQEDSPPPRKQGFLRTGAGSIKSEPVGQGHRVAKSSMRVAYEAYL